MRLLLLLAVLLTFNSCQNPSRLHAAASGPFVDLGFTVPSTLLSTADEVIE
jgi:hypothetical protein